MLPGQQVSIEIEGIGTLTNPVAGTRPEEHRLRRSSDNRRYQGPRLAVLGDLAPHEVRVRFPPSPTGNLHVGNVQRAVQLGFRQALRRFVVPGGGHRRWAQPRGVIPVLNDSPGWELTWDEKAAGRRPA